MTREELLKRLLNRNLTEEEIVRLKGMSIGGLERELMLVNYLRIKKGEKEL